MAQDPRDDEPSLELPSLRSALRRKEPRKNRSRRPARRAVPRFPGRRSVHVRMPGPVAAVLTGALVGLALVGLTAGALHLCTSRRGTSSCGEPGILLLLAITVVVAALGGLLLRLLGAAAAWSTSLLGVGLLVVLVLLALVAVGGRGGAVVALPLLSALTYLAAWWLTTTYDEPGELTR